MKRRLTCLPMAPPVGTDRLRLRRFRGDDLDALAAMFADPEQMTFYARTRTREEATEWLDRHLRIFEECGYGFWAIEGRADRVFSGYCGIRPLDLDGVSETEIAWRVEKSRWNQAVATEAAHTVVAIARDRYALSRLTALIPPEHTLDKRLQQQ